MYLMQADVVSQVLHFGLAAPNDVQIQSQDLTKAVPVARQLEAAPMRSSRATVLPTSRSSRTERYIT